MPGPGLVRWRLPVHSHFPLGLRRPRRLWRTASARRREPLLWWGSPVVGRGQQMLLLSTPPPGGHSDPACLQWVGRRPKLSLGFLCWPCDPRQSSGALRCLRGGPRKEPREQDRQAEALCLPLPASSSTRLRQPQHQAHWTETTRTPKPSRSHEGGWRTGQWCGAGAGPPHGCRSDRRKPAPGRGSEPPVEFGRGGNPELRTEAADTRRRWGSPHAPPALQTLPRAPSSKGGRTLDLPECPTSPYRPPGSQPPPPHGVAAASPQPPSQTCWRR